MLTECQDIAKEATLWRRLDHPNVVPFYGLDKDHFELSMVCKWMQNGHIVKFLGKNPSASRPQTVSPTCCQLLLDVVIGSATIRSWILLAASNTYIQNTWVSSTVTSKA